MDHKFDVKITISVNSEGECCPDWSNCLSYKDVDLITMKTIAGEQIEMHKKLLDYAGIEVHQDK